VTHLSLVREHSFQWARVWMAHVYLFHHLCILW
jgi:hypothetical protein